MKIQDIIEPGFYWNRLDNYREWTVVKVERLAKNPLHPKYNTFKIAYILQNPAGWVSELGEFIGPLTLPKVQT